MFKSKVVVLIVALAISGASVADINIGLVAYYPFNGNANDESGNGNNGVVRGAQLTTDALGNLDSAYSFNGIGDEITVADTPNLRFSTSSPQSISMWLYRTRAKSIMHFIGKRIGCGGDFGNYQFAFNEASGENIVYSRNRSARRLPLNKWTHLVATFDGVTARTYMNGLLVARKDTPLGAENNAPLKIGGSGTCARFQGGIDEVRVYNRALSGDGVFKLYNQFAPVSGTVKSLATYTVSCENKTTGQVVNVATRTARAYDCEAEGLKVNAGEGVSILIEGNAE